MKLKYTLLCGVAALGLSTQLAQAALVHLPGATVDFYYDTADIDPKFGTVYVSGDTIFAQPTTFSASDTTSGDGSVLTSGQGTIQVVARDGYSFTGITVGEGGIYNVSNSLGSVDVNASLRLFDWNDPLTSVPGSGGTEEFANMIVSGLGSYDGENHNWSASGSFDMTTSTWTDINHVGLSLTNLLTATAADNGTAYIDKYSVGAVGFTFETVVPVPAAVWLFGSGLIALVGFARRQK